MFEAGFDVMLYVRGLRRSVAFPRDALGCHADGHVFGICRVRGI